VDTVKFKAKLDTVVCPNEGFKVYGMSVDRRKPENKSLKVNKYGTVTIVGDLPELEFGVEYIVEGTERNNGKFGYQYVDAKIYRDKPTSLDEIRKFLEEILTYRQADTLLKVYPDIVDRVMNNEEVDLSLTKGIKEASFEKIKNRIIKDFCLMELISEYSSYGMTLTMIRKLYNLYGSVEKVKEQIEKDPYNCLCKLNGVGFIKADNMIMAIKPLLKNSRQRCGACIKFHLEQNEVVEGSTYILRQELFNKVYNLVGEECAKNFDDVIMFSQDLYTEGQRIAIRKTYECELYNAKKIFELNQKSKPLNINWMDYIKFDGVELTEQQSNAVNNVCKYKVSILAGYAGSGKTQTTKAVINMLEDNKLTYALFAPTGRASQVLGEYTEREASTIHRGLGYGVGEDGKLSFFYNEDNPLNVDVLIVDEYSMVDVFLMRHLLRAVSMKRTRILFILDPKQLPSVGCGNNGFDMIESNIIPITILTKIFRYGEGGLMQVATKIRNGENYVSSDMVGIHNFGEKQDYSFISTQQENSVSYALSIYKALVDRGVSLDEIIVLSSMNKGDYGTIALNKHIQNAINPPSPEKNEYTYGNTTFREGDRVIQTKNNYRAVNEYGDDAIIFNGNIGTVKKIVNNVMIVEYDNISILYKGDSFNQLLLGYSITIHKSQGSAFKHVILMTPKSHVFFLNRNLMYVGVTRAKERVYHITSPDVVRMALREEATFARNTFLKDKLIEIKNLVDKGELKCYNDIIVNKGDDIDELIEEDYEILD
jgi:RecD/TraA family predicted helicase